MGESSRAAKGDGYLPDEPNANGVWRGYITVDGRRKYFTGKTKAAAAQKRRQLIRGREEGTLTLGRAPKTAAWLNHWLDNVAKVRPTTAQAHRFAIDKHLIPQFGDTAIDKLTVEQLERWVNKVTTGPKAISPATVRRYLAPLRAALNEAIRRGKLKTNVAQLAILPKLGRRDTSAYSREDRDAILAAATGWNRARWHLALILGIRPSGVLGLVWQDFDAKTGALRLGRQLLRTKEKGLFLQDAAKTDAGQKTIRLPKSLANMLVEHRREQLAKMAEMGEDWIGWEYNGKPVALIFCQENGRPIDSRMDTKNWKALLTAAGLPEERRYKSRHTAATHLLEASGGDVAVVADLLGHADPAFTYRVYVHPMQERRDALMDVLDSPIRAPYFAPYEAGDDGRQRTNEEATPE